MLSGQLFWKYLLPHSGAAIRELKDIIAARKDDTYFSSYESLAIEDSSCPVVRFEDVATCLQRAVRDKKEVYFYSRGYSRKIVHFFIKQGFRIEELYWVYYKKNSRSFWLIPLMRPKAFIFSLNSILGVIADNPLFLKKVILYSLFKAGVLKYFVNCCVVAKKDS